TVQTSGVGSISVAPVITRKDADDTTTDSRTTTRPTTRSACLLPSPNRAGCAATAGTAAGGSDRLSLAEAASCMQSPDSAWSVGRNCEPARRSLQDKCCRNVTL